MTTHRPAHGILWRGLLVTAVLGLVALAGAPPVDAAEKHPEYSNRLKEFKKVIGGKLEVPEVPTMTDENGQEVAEAFGRVEETLKAWPKVAAEFAGTPDPRVFKELLKSLKKLQRTIQQVEQEYQEIYKQLQAVLNSHFRYTEEFYRQEGRFPQSIDRNLKSARNALTPKAQRMGRIWNTYLRVRRAIEQGLRTNLEVMGEDAKGVWNDALNTALKAKDPEDRAAFAMALGRMGGKDAEEALLKLDASAKGELDIISGMRALADMRSEEGLKRIIKRMDQAQHGVVRLAAVQSLRQYRHKEVLPALIGVLDSSEGRLLADIYDTLFDITGQRIAEASQAWKHFWKERGEEFLKRWSPDEKVRQEEIENITFQDPRRHDIAAELAALFRTEPLEKLRLEILESLSLQRSYYARVTLVDALRDRSLAIRMAAIRALGRYRHLAVPPALMERVQAVDANDSEQKEELQELYTALKKLWGGEGEFTVTRPDKEMLIQWWDTNKGRVAEQLIKLAGGKAVHGRPSSPEEESPWRGRNFYGLQIRSSRVLFVVDISFSMDEPAKEDPNLKKIDVAKRELKRAIKSLPDGGTFSGHFFSYQYWQKPDRQIHTDGKDINIEFGPGLVQVNRKNKEKALAWVDAVRTGASTNIYDPMELAFKFGKDPEVVKDSGGLAPDTIFLVSDGAPTSGKFTDVEVIREHILKWNKTGRMTVNTIGVGKDQDIAFLRALAEENGGRYSAK